MINIHCVPASMGVEIGSAYVYAPEQIEFCRHNCENTTLEPDRAGGQEALQMERADRAAALVQILKQERIA